MRDQPQRNDANANAEVAALIPSLRAFARTYERVPERADELVQETLLRALGAIDSFRPDARLDTWLFAMLRNAFYTSFEGTDRPNPKIQNRVVNVRALPDSQDWRCRSSAVRDAMSMLTPQQAEVLSLIAIMGMSYGEAAEICGCDIGAIKSRLNTARAALLLALDEVSAAKTAETDGRPLAR